MVVWGLPCVSIDSFMLNFAGKLLTTPQIMETRKFKQVPSINRIGLGNPNIPRPVIVSCRTKKVRQDASNGSGLNSI